MEARKIDCVNVLKSMERSCTIGKRPAAELMVGVGILHEEH